MPRIIITAEAAALMQSHARRLIEPGELPGISLGSTDEGQSWHPGMFFTDAPENYREYCLQNVAGMKFVLDVMDTQLDDDEVCALAVSEGGYLVFLRHFDVSAIDPAATGNTDISWEKGEMPK